MGPFGIAAVGLLANKGSGAKKKKNCNGWEDHSMKPESCSDACSTGTTNAAGNTTTPKCAAKESLHRKETATKEHCEFVRKEKLHDVIYHYGVSGAVNTREGHDKSERFFPKKGTRWKADLSEGCTSVCKGGSAIASQKSLTQIRTSRSPVCVRIVTSASDTSLQGEISNAQSSDALMPANDSNWHDIGEGETDGHPSVNHSAGLNKLRRSTKIKTESINEYFEKTQDASGHDSWTESCPKLQEHASLKKLNSYQCDLGHQKNDQAYISTSDNKSQDIGSSLAVGSKTDLPSGLFLTGPSLTTNTARSTLSGVSVDNITSKEAAGHSEGSLREADSPRFKALLHLTSGLQKKRLPSEMTSFSHELSSSGFGSHSFWRQHNAKSSEAVTALEARFYNAKKEVDLELAVFAADLLDVMESEAGNQDEISQARQEDLLILAQKCSVMPAEAFRKQCECIVQKLDDERQSLPIGRLKQLHTRMLFILTRCTRLLQYQKESAVPKDKMVLRDSRSGFIGINSPSLLKISTKQYYSQEQQVIDWRNNSLLPFCSPSSKVTNNLLSDLSTPEKVSVPHLNSKFLGNDISRISSDSKVHAPSIICDAVTSRKSQKEAFMLPAVSNKAEALLLDKRVQTGNLDDMVICRICEDEVPTVHLEEHSRVCALAFHCDVKGFSVDDRLHKLADILVGLLDSHTPHSSVVSQGASPDIFKPSIFSESTLPKLSDCYHKNIDDSPDNTLGMDAMSFKSLFGTKSEVSHASSSAGSLTPRSPITNLGHFGVQLAERISLSEVEDTAQISELADIARCVARIRASDNGVLEYLVLCAQDLQDLFKHCSYDALTFQTFGKRIEKLLREKYLQIREYSTEMNTLRAAEEAQQCFQTDNYQSIRTASSHPPYKDRTSIDDFEIIKPISRGAYGRVFLAKKRTTGDLFAIKVLRKADMIRKNAVESILAERNILISTCNPFVVRFFYSFTCSENLYLVMEYLLGGDLYSLLRNVGCLDENITRIYMAEVVLALEYLHSLGVVHRDLKPDNLLIGQNGHIKLTDFGLSKVGLINSTDDLSGPVASGYLSSLNQNSEVNLDHSLSSREQRQKHSAVGTPDYLAPEILLGTGHGSSADWWSTGIILFECLTGVPPFNAENPQRIFDSILNRKIPWPHVPEEMSIDAKDLIDKLLTEDPNTRLGAKGAAEVKNHPFFDGVNWDTLARQKAAFIPNPESPHDTSYFTCRHDWNASEDIIKSASEASRNANRTDGFCDYVASREHVDEPTALVEFASSSPSRFSFSNFSFKNLPQLVSINYDLLMQTGKDTAGFQSHR